MRRRKLDTIAKRWWRSVDEFDYDDHERVWDIVQKSPLLVSQLLPSLVRAVPEHQQLAYIGTSVVEDLHFSFEYAGKRDRTFEVLLAARLSQEQLFLVLCGVYPDLLVQWGVQNAMDAVLSKDQIDFLIDGDAPARHDYL